MSLNMFAAHLRGLRVNTASLHAAPRGVFLALVLAASCLVGCGGGSGSATSDVDSANGFDEALTAEELADDTSSTDAQEKGVHPVPVPAPAPNPAFSWNELALQAARSTNMSDGDAARLYAMVNIAMYDAVNGIEACIIPRRTFALVHTHGAPHGASLSAAASAAARAVLNAEVPALATQYEAQHQADLALLRNGKARSEGVAWGISVANQIVALRQNDGRSGTETQAGSDAPGQFRKDWNTQLRRLKPFAIHNPDKYVRRGPPGLTSAEYAAAFNDVKLAGDARRVDDRALATFKFWAGGGGTSQPAGEWIKLSSTLARSQHLSLPETTRLFALVGMALSDVVAPSYTDKTNAHHWRPFTAIVHADEDGNAHTDADAQWTPRGGGGDGTSPEYLSGHSTFAGAGAGVLRGFFCTDALRFTMLTDTSVSGTRSYSSLSEAEAEAGRSRILGGVHFEFSNQDGQALGHGVADEVLSQSLLRTQGETHRHQHGSVKTCPK